MVPLEISFRATEPVLRAVDAVFRQDEAADGVALDGATIRHVAARAGHAGLVELWPPVPAEPEEPPDPTALPVAAPAQRRAAHPAGARDRRDDRGLARHGERLEPRGRAIAAGDIMVLVRRRNAFVGDLLRALKAARRAGRRRRPARPDRAARGAGPGRARPLPAAAGRRSDPGDGAEGPAVRHLRGRAVPARL